MLLKRTILIILGFVVIFLVFGLLPWFMSSYSEWYQNQENMNYPFFIVPTILTLGSVATGMFLILHGLFVKTLPEQKECDTEAD